MMEPMPPRRLSLYMAIGNLLVESGVTPEKILDAKYIALKRVHGMLNWYEKEGYDEKILDSIMAKKAKMILKATTMEDIREITMPPKPRYDGRKWYTSPNSVPEEEMILWSITSLKAGRPLKHEAVERYMKLFKDFYGKSVDELLKG